MDDALLLQEFGTLTPLARASDFDVGWQPGIDASVTRCLPCCGMVDAIGARYFGVTEFDDEFRLTLPNGNNLPVAVSPFGTFGNGAAQNWLLSYESELQSVEVNAYRQFNRKVTLLAGARWIRLDEQLRMDANAPVLGQSSVFTFDTENNLYGFQIGALGRALNLRCNRLHVDGLIKAGIYANEARHDALLRIQGVGAAQFSANDRTTHAAFCGEVGASVTYDLSRCWSIQAGYQCYWVTGVAIAGDQIGATNLVTQTGINVNSDAFYHGATAGITGRF